DNIPLLSYALLHGRCRHCNARISVTYPIVEGLTALLVVVCFAVWDAAAEAVLAACLCSVLVVLSTIDANEGISARKTRVPLVPFLSFGAVVALFFGTAIVDASGGLPVFS